MNLILWWALIKMKHSTVFEMSRGGVKCPVKRSKGQARGSKSRLVVERKCQMSCEKLQRSIEKFYRSCEKFQK